VLFTVHSVNVNGFVVLRLEGFAAVLARVLPSLDVPRLNVVRDRLEARTGLVANRAIRLVRHPVELDELPDFAAIV